ncbi:hypothetical protein EYF80_025109 [Liparis tanakae]|uniref:Uncharacterized protein n=1 Tax=Liparis tanakae TaxID=230148 RepID=A0A4Z2HIM1_9TELE|nr:hypothetical protein EYF80_025109 [Liparis tanakae]
MVVFCPTYYKLTRLQLSTHPFLIHTGECWCSSSPGPARAKADPCYPYPVSNLAGPSSPSRLTPEAPPPEPSPPEPPPPKPEHPRPEPRLPEPPPLSPFSWGRRGSRRARMEPRDQAALGGNTVH